MHSRALAIAGCLITAAAVSNDEVTLVHAPRADTSRTTTIEVEQELAGGELSVVMGGQAVQAEYLPELDLVTQDRRKLSITETFLASGEEGPTEWLRRYDEVSWSNAGSITISQMDSEDSSSWTSEAETPLVERTVRFSSDDGEAVARELADDAAEVELDGLQVSLGLAELLPEAPVEVKDSWTVDGETLAVLLEPGGDFAWELDPEAQKHMLADIDERSHAGELRLVLLAVSKDGDARIARCSVEGELVRTTIQPGDLSMVPVTDGTATDTIEERWDASGELRWDLDEGCIVSLLLEGEFVSETHTVRDPDQPGGTYESTFTVEGSYSVRVESEHVEGRAVEAAAAR